MKQDQAAWISFLWLLISVEESKKLMINNNYKELSVDTLSSNYNLECLKLPLVSNHVNSKLKMCQPVFSVCVANCNLFLISGVFVYRTELCLCMSQIKIG